MDTEPCSSDAPPEWQTSIAIYAHEPETEDNKELCEDRISYVKVTCTISGIQPSPDEYFGCYGVLLNVSILPFYPGTSKPGYELINVDFSKFQIGSNFQGVLEAEHIKFEHGSPQDILEIIDIPPGAGDGKGELDLKNILKITIPEDFKVSLIGARVALGPNGGTITVMAFKDQSQVPGSPRIVTAQSSHSELVIIQADGIEDVRIETQSHAQGASLLEFFLEKKIDLKDYPHIYDFEPQKRDLYQSATEEGELLSASRNEVNVTKSQSHTETTETGISAGVEAGAGVGVGSKEAGGASAEVKGSVGISRKHGETNQDSSVTQVDASRERRERYATTTNIAQMYNLLTGYHPGTNRAVFIMLPRPHILQPTDLRAFIHGLRIIEGFQDFFLIVRVPKKIPAVCIKTSLDTGHFSEEVANQPPKYDLSYEDFEINKFFLESRVAAHFTTVYTVREGYIIDYNAKSDEANLRNIPDDPKQSDQYHRGIAEISKHYIKFGNYTIPNNANANAIEGNPGFPEDAAHDIYQMPKLAGQPINSLSLTDYSYQAENASTVRVEGTVQQEGGKATFRGRYRIFTRSQDQLPAVVDDNLIITNRKLCACYKSKDSCLDVIPYPEEYFEGLSFVEEPLIKTEPKLLTQDILHPQIQDTFERSFPRTSEDPESSDPDFASKRQTGVDLSISIARFRASAVKDLLRRIESAMAKSPQSISRRPAGVVVAFTDTNYFMNKMAKSLAEPISKTKVSQLTELPRKVREQYAPKTIGELLKTDLSLFAKTAGINIENAVKVRRNIMKGIRRLNKS